MKRFPITLIPIIILLLFGVIFKFKVPEGGDLISLNGDYFLGLVIGIILGVCILTDIRKFKRR